MLVCFLSYRIEDVIERNTFWSKIYAKCYLFIDKDDEERERLPTMHDP